MMIAIVLPTVYYLPGEDGGGVHENALDAGVLFSNNSLLAGLVVSYWISIAFYNFCGLAVAKSLSSVHRCLIDACRTVLVWGIELILAYASMDASGHYVYGEKWHPESSYIQLIGFGELDVIL